jgi:hypothetical protein
MNEKEFFERIKKVIRGNPSVLEIGKAEKNFNNEIISIIEPDNYDICYYDLDDEVLNKPTKYDFIFLNCIDFINYSKFLNKIIGKSNPRGYIGGDGFIKYMYAYKEIKNFVEKNNYQMVMASEFGLWTAAKKRI